MSVAFVPVLLWPSLPLWLPMMDFSSVLHAVPWRNKLNNKVSWVTHSRTVICSSSWVCEDEPRESAPQTGRFFFHAEVTTQHVTERKMTRKKNLLNFKMMHLTRHSCVPGAATTVCAGISLCSYRTRFRIHATALSSCVDAKIWEGRGGGVTRLVCNIKRFNGCR